MYIERNGSRIMAAYLDEQFPGQEWLPIESRALQSFLATAPSVGRGRRRPVRLVAGDWSLNLRNGHSPKKARRPEGQRV